MKKDIIIDKYLAERHIMTLSIDSMVRELCEISGMDIVKELYRSHEGSRGYIPMLHSIELLWYDVIKDNFDMNLKEMQDLTGLSIIAIKKIKRDLVDTGEVQIKNQVRMFEIKDGEDSEDGN